jgi:NAD(P)-dependent dehydrogenase (short-subunit alcohol dehydrogenase family)
VDVRDQAAIVTGAASGIGAATAQALCEAGAKVALLDVNADGVTATARNIGGLGIACDVADTASTSEALAAAREAHGPARILVNCAGIPQFEPVVGPDGPMPMANFERVVAVNLIGTFNTIRLMAAELASSEVLADDSRGVIVNVAANAAFDGPQYTAGYTASKGGVVSMTLGLAREFAELGIRVMCITPGPVRTPMLEVLPAAILAKVGDSVPFPRRMGEPMELAKLVLHICENTFLNGEVIRLDGAHRTEFRSTE